MKEWIKRIVDERKRKTGEPLEVKTDGRNCYLYRSTTVWSKEEKKRKKVSKYIGKITEDGIVEGCQRKRSVRSIFEYGNARLLMKVAEEIVPHLRNAFPEDYNEIIAMAIIRVLQSTPIRLIKSRWEKIYLLNEIDASLSPNIVSEKLRFIGANWSAQKEFFEHLVSDSKYLVFDLSSIFSHSENLKLAEKGYNPQHRYLKQVNFALFFSLTHNTPVMMKSMPGSIRDIKALRYAVKEMPLKSTVVVLDTGFASYSIPDLLQEKEMGFVLPLRRNFRLIDYDTKLRGCFIYRGRGINWNKKKVGENYLYLFEDVKLRAEEETTFIEMINEGKRKRDELDGERKKFGKIAILSSLDEGGEQIYLLFKSREEIECVFDVMKNEMENDKCYLSDDDAVRGYFFISFVSLYIYFRILDLLRQNDLIGKTSVNELLFELSKVYLIYYSDNQKRLSEIPRKVEMLDKTLKMDLFPIELRS